MADVLPIDAQRADEDNGVVVKDMTGMTAEEVADMIPSCYFMTISGQHSSVAMQWIVDDVKDGRSTSDHVKELAKKFATRPCKILKGSLPPGDYRALSSLGNIQPREKVYETPYVSHVQHMKMLWHQHGCPKRPDNKASEAEKRKRTEEYEVSSTFNMTHLFVD